MSKLNWLAGFVVAGGLSGPITATADNAPASLRVERGNMVTENVPDVPAALAERLQQYANTRSASFADWHPDSASLLISTRFGEAPQLHSVRSALGARRQLTYFDEPVSRGRYVANGTALLFIRDVGGSEDFQIYIQDVATGRTQLVSDGKSRHTMPVLSPDRTKFMFSSNRRNGRDMDVYIADVAAPAQAKLLYEAAGSWSPESWSSNGQHVAITQSISVSESRLFVVDVATGNTREVKALGGKAALGSPQFSGDGDGLFYTSDDGSEFTQLRFRNLKTGREQTLSADTPWDVTALEMSPDGKRLAYVVNADGLDQLRLLDTQTMKPIAGPRLPDGQVGRFDFSPDSNRLALSLSTPTSPSDVYVYDIAVQTVSRWTESETGGLDPATFVAAQKVRYPSFDKVKGAPRQIPALVYKPKTKPGPFPVIIQIHGGPEGQETASFVAETQAFVNELGAAVIKPNVRGSTGYGKSYHTLDNGILREDSVKDIGALLDWIGAQPDLDPKRVVVYGGSYGGFMVLASMVKYNDRLAGGIDVVGISNFITFLSNTRGYRQDLRRVEYGDERDPAIRNFFQRISPLNNASRITKPMLIVQGFNDPRVPVGESEQMLAAINKNGGQAWYVMAKDEGHGFRKKSNRAYQQQVGFMFLERLFKPSTN